MDEDEGGGFESDYEREQESKTIKSIKAAGLWFAYSGNGSAAPLRSSYSPQKMIYLKSSEGERFEVEETVALESKSIRDYLEEDPEDRTMPFAGVPSKIMPKVIEYLKRHVDVEAKSEDLEKFDAEFVNVDKATFGLLCKAAFALEIKSLWNLIIQARKARKNDKMWSKERIEARKTLKGKTPAEARKMSTKEMIEAVAGVESGLLSVASTHTHPQSSKFKLCHHGENTVTKKRKEDELSGDSKDYSIIIKDDKRQKAAATKQE